MSTVVRVLELTNEPLKHERISLADQSLILPQGQWAVITLKAESAKIEKERYRDYKTAVKAAEAFVATGQCTFVPSEQRFSSNSSNQFLTLYPHRKDESGWVGVTVQLPKDSVGPWDAKKLPLIPTFLGDRKEAEILLRQSAKKLDIPYVPGFFDEIADKFQPKPSHR
jgi:hypothetical protein